MNGFLSLLYNRNVYLILLAALALSTVSMAETWEFKVLYADVPGVEKALAGNLDAAIEILESKATNIDNHYVADEQATLCALYVAKGKIDAARKTCNAAVEIDQSDIAYNNRGVLRARLGDTAGALEDFDHARVLPDDQHRFIENLKRGNARLTASRNFALTTEIVEGHRTKEWTLAGAVKGADIEDLSK